MGAPPRGSLTSSRLTLEPPSESDAAETAAAMTPGVARWLVTWPSPMTEEEVLKRIEAYRSDIASGDAVHFVLRSLVDHALVGWTSAWRDDQQPDEWQIGFWIAEPFQGQGYAFEAASAVLEHVIRAAGPRALCTTVHPDNVRSIAVLRRLGLAQVGETSRVIAYSGREEPALIFRRQLEAQAPAAGGP